MMMITKKYIFALLLLLGFENALQAQQKTYCNPINIDYGYTPFEVFSQQGKHRTTADPVIVNFKNKYYLFSTNQEGYWWSENMLNWNFISHKFLLPRDNVIHDLNAPSAFVMEDTLYLIGSTHENNFPLWKTTEPEKNIWKIAVDSMNIGAWDPAFFYDNDTKKLYAYWGSSNEYPLSGTEINLKTLKGESPVKALISLHHQIHGWERFGEYNDNTFLPPFIEGAEMTKYNDHYYLQYAAPGTEFSGYADGVYISKNPLEGFVYQQHNPFSYKPGGFARGAGHGSTFQDNYGKYWHVSTMVIGVKNNFERRIGIWPAGFDSAGVMFTNTAYGDYPTLLPQFSENHSKGNFTGWMLLNYQKSVKVSSTLGGYQANYAVDEDIKTYWSAKTNQENEWIQTDLGETSTVYAIQINYADQDVEFLGKTLNMAHKYKIFASLDGEKWDLVIDKSKNASDIPHDYIELSKPLNTRYLKMVNIAMPTGKFAISGFRVFGIGDGQKPEPVQNFIALRAAIENSADRRNSWLKWEQNPLADGYTIYFGKSPDKLYGSIMVYGKNEYYFSGMDRNDIYYFQIEAFNNNGISTRSQVVLCK